ncbi:MAG: hypothetical protein H7138_03015 [Myxococcales bacterium]|nr:hypothetical protein [Myxococcales bacterium]
MLRYPWPGNVRELGNAIERAVVMATGSRIDVGDLPAEVGAAAATTWVPGDHRSLADVEKDYLLAVLAAEGGNRARAATRLGISSATLYRKLAETARKASQPRLDELVLGFGFGFGNVTEEAIERAARPFRRAAQHRHRAAWRHGAPAATASRCSESPR